MSTAKCAPISHLNKIIGFINEARYCGPVPDDAMDHLTDSYFKVIDEMIETPSIDNRDVQGKFTTMRTLYEEGAEGHVNRLADSIDADLARFSTVSQFISA